MLDRIYKVLIYLGFTFLLVWGPLAHGAVPKRVWSIAPVLLVVCFLVFIWLWRAKNSPRSTVHGPQSMVDGPQNIVHGPRSTVNGLHHTPLDILIFAFAALAVISFAFSIYKHDSFYALLRLFAYVGIFYLIINNYSWSLRRYLIGLVIFIWAGLSI